MTPSGVIRRWPMPPSSRTSYFADAEVGVEIVAEVSRPAIMMRRAAARARLAATDISARALMIRDDYGYRAVWLIYHDAMLARLISALGR